MAGFGEAFSRSFENARQNRAVKERDLFKVAYDSYIEKKDAYSKADTEWSNAMKKGQVVAQKYGIQPEVVPTIAEWYSMGYSDAEVDDMVANSKFTVTPNTPLASDVNSTLPVEDQMTAAGLPMPEEAGAVNNPVTMPMPAPQQPEQPTNVQTPNPMFSQLPQSGNTDLLGGMLGPDGIFKNAGKSDMAKAEGQVLEQTGTTAEQMAQYNSGFQPPANPNTVDWQYTKPNDGKTITPLERTLGEFGLDGGITDAKFMAVESAAKIWANSPNKEDQDRAKRWEALKPAIELQLKDNVDPEVMKLLQPVNSDFMRLATLKADTVVFAEEASKVGQLGAELEGIGLTQVGQVAGWFEGVKREAIAALSLAGSLASQDGSENDVIGLLNKEISSRFNTPELASAGRATALYTAALLRLVYRAGKMQGQEGNGFSNKDFDYILKQLQASSDIGTFTENLQNYVESTLFSTNTALETTASSPAVQYLLQHEDTKPFLVDLFVPVQLSQNAQDWMNQSTDEYIKGETYLDDEGNSWVFNGGDPNDKNNYTLLGK